MVTSVGSFSAEVIAHTVQTLQGYRVTGRVRSLSDVFDVAPPFKVRLHHGTDFSVQEAVDQSDEEPLAGDENVAGEDEDSIQGGVGFRGTDESDQIGDAQERDDDDEGLCRSQINILRLQIMVARS